MQASSSAAAANVEELAELNRKLKSSEDDLDLLNKWFDEAQGKSELTRLLGWLFIKDMELSHTECN
jgi:hypothetical protein